MKKSGHALLRLTLSPTSFPAGATGPQRDPIDARRRTLRILSVDTSPRYAPSFITTMSHSQGCRWHRPEYANPRIRVVAVPLPHELLDQKQRLSIWHSLRPAATARTTCEMMIGEEQVPYHFWYPSGSTHALAPSLAARARLPSKSKVSAGRRASGIDRAGDGLDR